MGWKRKEKELSPEEAIALAKTEAAPYWVGLTPQFTCISKNGTITIHPLETKFQETNWLISFLDLTSHNSITVALHFREWVKRYSSFPLRFLMVYSASGPYSANKKFILDLLEEYRLDVGFVIDHDHKITDGFAVKKVPHVLLLSNSKIRFFSSEVLGLDAFESKVQNFLRETDPGLPLPRPQEFAGKHSHEISAYEFRSETSFDPKLLPDASTPEIHAQIQPGEFYLIGKWDRDQEKISTQDPKARLIFICPTSEFSIVTGSLTKLIEHGKVVVEIDGVPAFQDFQGNDLDTDESGQSYVPVKKPKVYSVLRNLPKNKRFIELKFPVSNRIPIALYGIRFTEPFKP